MRFIYSKTEVTSTASSTSVSATILTQQQTKSVATQALLTEKGGRPSSDNIKENTEPQSTNSNISRYHFKKTKNEREREKN
jgi:hypothetical protein